MINDILGYALHRPCGRVLLFMICLQAISCKKFLDEKSNSNLIVPTSIADLQGLMDDATTMNYNATPSYGEVSSDDYFLSEKAYDALAVADQYSYTWKYYDIGSGNDWADCYQKIYNSNLCLERIGDVGRTTANSAAWGNVKGSALFFRAYYFLQLAWTYSKAYDAQTAAKDYGIALRLGSDFNVPSVRASVQDTYTQIINDAKASLLYLPTYPTITTRPAKAAAYGLLARCYLSMRQYSDALLYADSSLQLNSSLMDYNNDADITVALTKNVPFKKFNKETVFYTEMNNYYTLQRTNSKSRIDTLLYSFYDNNDLRKTGFYSANADGYQMFKATYTASIFVFFSGITTAEMYLVRSECYLRSGNLSLGLKDLNALLVKRYKTGTFVNLAYPTVDLAITRVLMERRKELVMRGLRWMDIKRLNKGGGTIVLTRNEGGTIYTLQPNANFYALPLPADIVRLTGMPQNDF